MADENPTLLLRLTQSVKGHLGTAGIALVFGMSAYGLIHILIWVVSFVENLGKGI